MLERQIHEVFPEEFQIQYSIVEKDTDRISEHEFKPTSTTDAFFVHILYYHSVPFITNYTTSRSPQTILQYI